MDWILRLAGKILYDPYPSPLEPSISSFDTGKLSFSPP